MMGINNRDIVLIAPNVSEQMGGEAMKALQIYLELKKINPNVVQVTHARNRDELSHRLKLENIYYVEDTPYAKFIWNSVLFRPLLETWFEKKAIKIAEVILDEKGDHALDGIIHQTEPNSPVYPRVASKKYVNVLGPINGNIYYPKIFRMNERLTARLRRIFHFPSQFVNKYFLRPYSGIDQVLCAGGDRTRISLLAGGCREEIILDSVDCGVKDGLLERQKITHTGDNMRFVQYGRLVFHKGTRLVIQSLAKTRNNITLDIVGTGPELSICKEIVKELKLENRVRFLGWYTSHNDLIDSLKDYRGMVLPSIEDANGIVVQEALALGLPSICLDWGGPQLLIDHGVSGYLVKPTSIEDITDQIAGYMDDLATNSTLAESISVAGREKAETWRWSVVAESWLGTYPVRARGK